MQRRYHPDRRTRITLVLALAVTAPVAITGSAQAAPSATSCAIQGSGAESPMAGQDVTTSGIVTAVDDNGVWIQQPGCDDDPATSDGLFAFRGEGAVGDRVDVTGEVTEFFGLTQVVAETTEVTGQAEPPAPTVIDADAATRLGYYETLEGMLVRLERGQTYVGTNQFGEAFLVPGSIEQRVRRTDDAPEVLAIDDGLPGTEPTDAFAFDRVTDAVGPLSFSFENYKLLNTQPAAVSRTPASRGRPEPIAQQPPATLSVATWNLLNVFDEIDDGGPATPELSPEEQQLKRSKIARGVVDRLRAPAVLAVQEVEKVGLLEAIAGETNDYAASQGRNTRYEAVLREGNDERGIDVGFLLDTSRVSYDNVRQLGADTVSSGRCDAGESGDLVHDRVPLAVDVTPVDSPRGARTTVVSNHFKSKFGGTPENDFFEDCRVEQAQVLRDDVADLPRVVLLGDFNAFRDSPTLGALTEGGYANTVDEIPADRRFSFVFQGRVQFLDHVVVSPALTQHVEAVDSSKLATDVPIPRLEDEPDTGPATSDHDPLVSYLRLPGDRQ